MHDLPTYLQTILENKLLPEHAHLLAKQTLEQWDHGIVPTPDTLKKLKRFSTLVFPPCNKSKNDGSCGWLRKYGEGHGIEIPPIGQKAMCSFRGMQVRCPGYLKRFSR